MAEGHIKHDTNIHGRDSSRPRPVTAESRAAVLRGPGPSGPKEPCLVVVVAADVYGRRRICVVSAWRLRHADTTQRRRAWFIHARATTTTKHGSVRWTLDGDVLPNVPKGQSAAVDGGCIHHRAPPRTRRKKCPL